LRGKQEVFQLRHNVSDLF